MSGPVRVDRDPAVVADAVARYAQRYRQPRVNPKRVALIIDVDRMLGSSRLRLTGALLSMGPFSPTTIRDVDAIRPDQARLAVTSRYSQCWTPLSSARSPSAASSASSAATFSGSSAMNR